MKVTFDVTMDKIADAEINESLWHSFGEWVEAERKKTPHSQAEAARLAGMERQQWNRIARGISGTKRVTVIRIAKAIGADVNEALDQAGFSDPNKTKGEQASALSRKVTAYLEALPADRQGDAIAYLELMHHRHGQESKPMDTSNIDTKHQLLAIINEVSPDKLSPLLKAVEEHLAGPVVAKPRRLASIKNNANEDETGKQEERNGQSGR